jgi:MFS family permease
MENERSVSGTSTSQIQWKQLLSLGALYASVLVGWIAYYKYQPRLLDGFGFSNFGFILIIAQGIILAITPPLAGMLGDRYREKHGHRLPIITSGISFAAMIFMAVAFTLWGNPGENLGWILPVLIILWLFAMSTFTSPALSTVELFAPTDRLPKAVAILTIIGNLIYALEPVIEDIIDYLGAPTTFMFGGLVVFISGYALKRNTINLFKLSENKEALNRKTDQQAKYLQILFYGLILGLSSGFLLNYMPDLLDNKLSNFMGYDLSGTQLVSATLVISALFTITASKLVQRFGLIQSLWFSFVLILALICVIITSDIRWMISLATLAFALSFALLSVSALPLALTKSSYKQKVFCVGVFFSGVEIPNSIMDVVIAYLQ